MSQVPESLLYSLQLCPLMFQKKTVQQQWE